MTNNGIEFIENLKDFFEDKLGKLMKNIITIQHTQSVHHTNGMVGAWTD